MVKFRWEKEFKETPIGKIPKDWNIKKLGEDSRFKIIMGQSPPSKYYNKDRVGLPFIQGKKEFGDIYVLPEVFTIKCPKKAPAGSVLISVRAPVGEVNITKEEICIGRGIAAIFCHKQELNKYIYYIFKEMKKTLKSWGARGTTYESVTKQELLEFQIPYPSPDEQKRIATVLSWFDDLIENKRRQNEILEKTAMAIFKSWFIDFKPFQDEEFVYSEELDMEVPKGWEVKPIGEVAEFTNGLSYKGSEKFSEYVNGAYVFITLNNVQRNGGFKTEYAWIKSGRLKKRHFLVEGDLIIANTDMTQDAKVIGAPALVVFPPNYNKSEGAYSHHITLIRPKEEILKLFMYLYLKYTQEDNVTYSTGTNVLGLDIANFKQNKFILVPPRSILKRFHFLVEPLFRKIIINEKEIMVLKKARDALLPQLVFGRLRVVEDDKTEGP